MKLNIKIITDNHCKVVIEDRTEYLKESSNAISKGEFRYSDTTSILVLEHNKIQETETKSLVFKRDRFVDVPIEFDGWFTINYIVLPNREWVERECQKEVGSALGMYELVYFADNNRIYKYFNGTESEVDIKEILEVNPYNTTISIISKDYISICFLQKCYINLCQQIFQNRVSLQCFNNNDIDGELVFKRDLVWMMINVIKYLTEFNQLAEVQRIIETAEGCNGLCSDIIQYNTNKNGGCGCS